VQPPKLLLLISVYRDLTIAKQSQRPRIKLERPLRFIREVEAPQEIAIQIPRIFAHLGENSGVDRSSFAPLNRERDRQANDSDKGDSDNERPLLHFLANVKDLPRLRLARRVRSSRRDSRGRWQCRLVRGLLRYLSRGNVECIRDTVDRG